MLLRKLIEVGGKGNARAIDQVLRHYVVAQGLNATRDSPLAAETSHDATEADIASLALLRAIILAEGQAGEGRAS
ncbi:hypothetical protein AB5I41_09875 [Sphingomonas sp. MMS24-JH45]